MTVMSDKQSPRRPTRRNGLGRLTASITAILTLMSGLALIPATAQAAGDYVYSAYWSDASTRKLFSSADGAQVYALPSSGDVVRAWAGGLGTGKWPTVNVGTSPAWIAFTPTGSKAYVTNSGSASVTPITTGASPSAGTAITVGSTPKGMAIGVTTLSAHPYAYVANQGDHTVSVIDTVSDTVVSTIAVADQPTTVTMSPDGSKVFVGCNGGTDKTCP